MHFNGYRFIDSTKVKLGQVIWNKGNCLQWNYDLGDNFIHDIEIQRVLTGDDADGRVEVGENLNKKGLRRAHVVSS
jgi:hypothetical protein